ncbi:alpha/beta hydrolase [Aurantiacibacter odishensis]|uniref:alpha/beta hydrolase n=1 Tax=Aurantiacibacter odishensis TaxID=1155476 RepID=UPI001F0B9DDA|nr:alpha/beta hydrolase-fold protein [Aurantiacibacter odishensis]
MKLLAALLALVLAGCTTAGPAGSPARFVEVEQMAAAGLPDQRLTIWLPPGYDSSERRYPVLYMHDGHNLFDPAKSNFDKVWAADKAMLAAMRDDGIEPHIIVGIWAPGEDRYRQYLPQSLYEEAEGAPRAAMDAMIEGPPVGSAYLDWLAGPLRHWVNANYRTQTGRDATAIAGSSMGGLMSCYAFLERPDVYGRAGCISSHWPAADPRIVGEANPELIALWDRWFAERLGDPYGRRVWMDHGTATLDAYYAPYQQAIDARFRASGWREGEHFRSEVYDGAAHEENAWAARLPEVFAWLLAEQ